ncbi:recombinase family protein [Clostridium beijerinckii]|uniref:recombinase family protein n=1 Tax=Clostridium beijerinckii TaxID=1520 RepID=UPI001F21F2A4|nr:recombinase family protein [Clostridium beijerinckii]
MKKIAIYTRKSRLTDTGDSIGTQIKLVKDYFRNQECEFEVFEDEGFSGGNTNRPAFQLMMEKIKRREFDTIAVYKIDRIARNIIDFFKIFETLEKENVSLVSISEGFDPNTPGGRITMTLIAGIAEMERMNIKQRVKDNMIELAKRGNWTGGNLPLGYESVRVNKNGKEFSYLKIKDDEKEIIEDIYNLFIEGYSIRKIAKIIEEKHNIYNNANRVSNILYSPIYASSCDTINKFLELKGYKIFGTANGNGYLTYQKSSFKNGKLKSDIDNKAIAAISKHEAIISSDIWLKVQERLKEVTVDPSPRSSQYTFLSKLVKCGYCKTNMRVYEGISYSGEPYRYFRKKCTCDHGNKKGSRLRSEKAEKAVLEILKSIHSSGVEELINKNLENSNEKDNSQKIKKELSKTDKMINNLTDKLALANENIIETLMNRIDDLVNKKRALQEELLIYEQRKNFKNKEKDDINILFNSIEQFIDDFNNMDVESKRIKTSQIFNCFYWYGKEKILDYELNTL